MHKLQSFLAICQKQRKQIFLLSAFVSLVTSFIQHRTALALYDKLALVYKVAQVRLTF